MDGLTTQGTYFEDIDSNNLELGVALHNSLGISESDMMIPGTVSKLQEISGFLGMHPDPVGTLNRVVRSNKSPNINNTDHLLSFVALSKEKMNAMDQLDNINNQLKYYD